MKRFILLLTVSSFLCLHVMAQDEEEEVKEKGFKKENLFTGGSVTASFFSGGTILGANPMFGYKLNDYVDAGLVFNYIYSGRRDYVYLNDKLRQHTYGPGIFTRIYPVRFLFLQGQFEHNFISLTHKYGGVSDHYHSDANSFLVGAGIAQGRQKGSNTFFYISLLVDVIKDPNSPYVNNVYNENTGALVRTDLAPIIRAGVNVGLFQGKYRR